MGKSERLQGIDTLKIIASFAVICLHTAPFEFSAQKYPGSFFALLEIIIYLLSRFAVPYFFISAGFFFGKSLEKGTPLAALYFKYVKRLVLIFLAWSIFYAIFTHHLIDNILSYGFLKGWGESFYQDTVLFITAHPFMLLLQGTGVHLWFLPALIMSLSVIAALLFIKRPRFILPLAAFLYMFGVLAGSYAKTPIGFDVGFNTRNGPFFGTLFTALGWRLSKLDRFSFKTALIILLTGCLLQLSEAFLLNRYFNINSFYDYGLGVVLFGIGVFFLGLSRPEWGKSSFLEPLSQLSLGIYLFHPFVYHIVLPFRNLFNPLLWDISLTFAVFTASAFAVSFLKSIPFTKQFIT